MTLRKFHFACNIFLLIFNTYFGTEEYSVSTLMQKYVVLIGEQINISLENSQAC
jgi:hypothetical protein